MKILNLVDLEKSDVKYKISKFPDGQQNIVILPFEYFVNNIGNIFTRGEGVKNFKIDKSFNVEIKSRLNNWLDLELIVCAVASLRELGVQEIHLYTPYIMGARSDRKFEEGGNNYLKDVICPIINSLNFKTVTCIDPHSDVLEACIKGFKKESNKQLALWALQDITKNKSEWFEELILVSPDAGASKKIYKLAEQIGYKGDIVTCSKDRDKDGKLVIRPDSGDPVDIICGLNIPEFNNESEIRNCFYNIDKNKEFIFKYKEQFYIVNSNYTFFIGSICSILVNNSPTGNCQLFCVSCFNLLLRYTNKETFNNIILSLRLTMGKPLMFIDVKQNDVIDKVDVLFNNCIVTKSPYISSNGSNMCIYVINVQKYIENNRLVAPVLDFRFTNDYKIAMNRLVKF